jgi:hypothetical protein
LLLLLGSIVFVAGALVALPSKAGEFWPWLCIILFGFGAFAALVLLARPQRLSLDDEGFVVSGGFVRKAKKVLWKDVGPFFVYRLPRGGKMIGYNLKPSAPEKSLLTSINGVLGAQAALPRLWRGKPETMVAELNAFRTEVVQ